MPNIILQVIEDKTGDVSAYDVDLQQQNIVDDVAACLLVWWTHTGAGAILNVYVCMYVC